MVVSDVPGSPKAFTIFNLQPRHLLDGRPEQVANGALVALREVMSATTDFRWAALRPQRRGHALTAVVVVRALAWSWRGSVATHWELA